MITDLNPNSWSKTTPSGKPRNYVLPSLDATEPIAAGEGLTRTSAAAARLFDLLLHFKASRPMRCTIRAISWNQAEQFARNRHPDLARIERLAQTGQVA